MLGLWVEVVSENTDKGMLHLTNMGLFDAIAKQEMTGENALIPQAEL